MYRIRLIIDHSYLFYFQYPDILRLYYKRRNNFKALSGEWNGFYTVNKVADTIVIFIYGKKGSFIYRKKGSLRKQ